MISQNNPFTRKPLLLLLAVVLVYLPSLHGQFAFDDYPNILMNTTVQPTTVADLPRITESRASASRPVALLSFAINYYFGGFDALGYHLVNLGVHLANTWLLYQLLLALARHTGHRDPPWLAFWGALLWAVNPVQVQAVTYIVQRMTSLATLFYLAALLLFVHYRQGRVSARWFWPLLAACLLLGLGSKEVAATLPLALLLVDYLFFGGSWLSRRTLLIGLGAFGLLLAWYLPGHLPNLFEKFPFREFSPYERVITQPLVLLHYLKVLCAPLMGYLSVDIAFPHSRGLLDPPQTLVALLSLGAAAVVALYWRNRYPLTAFSALFFLLASAIESSPVGLEMAFIHRLYLPSAFLFAGVIVVAGERLSQRHLVWPLMGLALFYGLNTIERNVEWGSRATLWRTNVERGGLPARSVINAAYELNDMGQYQQALDLIATQKTVNNPEETQLMYWQLGRAYLGLKRYDDAITAFNKTLDLYPISSAPMFYLCQAHLAKGDISSAEAVLGKLKPVFPRDVFTIAIEALIEGARGHADKARQLLEESLQQEWPHLPGRHLLMVLLSDLYRDEGRVAEARALLDEVVAQDGENLLARGRLHALGQ